MKAAKEVNRTTFVAACNDSESFLSTVRRGSDASASQGDMRQP